MWGTNAPLHAKKIVSLIQLGLPDCTLVSSKCGGQVSCHSLLLALHSPLLAELLQHAGGRKKEAGLMGQVIQGEVGLTLPLPLNTIKGLVALFQGEVGEVKKEVKDAVDFLGMGMQEEYGLVTGATLQEDLLSYWDDDPASIVDSNEDTKCKNKSLDTSEDGGEYNVLEKEREAYSDQSMGVNGGCGSLVKGANLEDDLPSKIEDVPHKSMEHTKCEDGGEYRKLEKLKVKCISEEYFGSRQSEDRKHNYSVKPRKEKKNGNTFRKKSQSSQNQVICIVCSKTFTNKYFLKKHIIDFHKQSERSAPCSHCSKQVSILYFSNHQNKCRMSSNRPKYDYELQNSSCESCEKTFLSRTKLKAHIKWNHEGRPKTKPKRASCNVCYRSFNNKKYLEKHILFVHINSGAKYVLCSVCEKEFPIISIASHERKCKMSDKEREDYKEKNNVFCQECGQTLSCQQKLTRHMANVHNH